MTARSHRPSEEEPRVRSNRRGHLARADWRFLLPGIEDARVLFLGPPSTGELVAIGQAAALVVVALTEPDAEHRVRTAIARESLDNVAIIRVDRRGELPLQTDAIDLIAVSGGIGFRALVAPAPIHRDVGRVLSPHGVVHLETRLPMGAILARRWGRKCLGSSFGERIYWVVRRKGSMRAALPVESAPKLAGYFFQSALYGRSRAGRALMILARALARVRLLHLVAWQRSMVLSRGSSDTVAFPYIRALAARHGLDLREARIGLLTSGAYDSNKNAFFVFPAASARPELIMKVTRTPAYNGRLEREYASLSTLGAGALVPPGTYPEALFLDHHEKLAVVAEKVVRGAPFRVVTTARPDCPAAARAVDWVTSLSAGSAVTADGNRAALARRFHEMLERLAAAYDLPERDTHFLERVLTRFRTAPGEVPSVFRHGDAGTWNILVTDGATPAFLDWELGEENGPPLWDLLDFTRSFGNWMARVAGVRDPVIAFHGLLEDGGPAFEFQRTAVGRYCDAVGVSPADIEPLFFFYWVDRALRQAAWADGPLAEATYIRLLRLCVERRNGKVLASLFGADRGTGGGAHGARTGPPRESLVPAFTQANDTGGEHPYGD